MDILLDLILWPFAALAQAVAAILWPSQRPDIRRLQRWTLVIVSVGVLALISGILGAYVAASVWPGVAIGGVGYICLVAGGILGTHIENRCRAENAETKS